LKFLERACGLRFGIRLGFGRNSQIRHPMPKKPHSPHGYRTYDSTGHKYGFGSRPKRNSDFDPRPFSVLSSPRRRSPTFKPTSWACAMNSTETPSLRENNTSTIIRKLALFTQSGLDFAMKCRPRIDAGKRSAGPYRLAIVAWAADVLFRVMGDRTRIIAVGF
jgi:hypothetical protein